MQEYNICYSLDSAYIEQLAVSIASILKNADLQENINFYILDGGLTQKDKKDIELLKNIKTFNIEYFSINGNDFSDYPLLKEKSSDYQNYHVTLPTYFRFKLPNLLTNLDKVLYLDCDVIVNTSLKKLFNISVDDYAVAMVLDADSDKESKRLKLEKYFNAGVMLINLDFWRKNKVEEKLLKYSKAHKSEILWQDQDIVNVVLSGKIKEISKIWNYQYFQYESIDGDEIANSAIVHLAGRFKPWLMPLEHFIYDLYYHYLTYTKYRNRIIDYKQKSSGKILKNNIGGRDTNIRLIATDEDIQNVYSEVSASYEFTKSQVVALTSGFADKFSKIYDEITENYEYTKENDENIYIQIKNDVDDKLGKIYTEISNNYDYTNKLSDTLKNEIYSLNINTEKVFTEKVDELINLNEEKNEKLTDKILNSSNSYTNEKLSELKNNIVSETDEKISKVYDEISKNYDFTKEKILESKEEIKQSVNSDVSQIYDEISKNYKYTEELSNKANEKADMVSLKVEELSNFVESSNIEQNSKLEECKSNLIKETDDKITGIYDEISKNYDFTKEKILESKEEIKQNINTNISQIYDEISKNYEYTNDCIKNTKTNIENKLDDKFNCIQAQNDNIINQLGNELKKQEDINRTQQEAIKAAEERVNLFELAVYEKINSDITTVNDKIVSINESLLSTNANINNVYEEIAKNNSYTEYLVQIAEEKQNQKRIEALNEIKANIDIVKEEFNSKVDSEVNSIKISQDEKIRILEEVFFNKINSDNEQIRKETTHKFSELYSYTNEHVSKLYKEVKDSNLKVENVLNDKIYDLYSRNENLKTEIVNIRENMAQKIDSEELNSKLSEVLQTIENQESEFMQNVIQIQNDFDEKINQQRIKYENKLINMENQLTQMNILLNESKKNVFEKLFQKIRKSKKR